MYRDIAERDIEGVRREIEELQQRYEGTRQDLAEARDSVSVRVYIERERYRYR